MESALQTAAVQSILLIAVLFVLAMLISIFCDAFKRRRPRNIYRRDAKPTKISTSKKLINALRNAGQI